MKNTLVFQNSIHKIELNLRFTMGTSEFLVFMEFDSDNRLEDVDEINCSREI